MLRGSKLWCVLAATLICCAAAAAPARAQGGEVRTWTWDLSAFIEPCASPCHFDAWLVGPGGGTVLDTRVTVSFQTVADFTGEEFFVRLFGPILQPDGSVGAEWEPHGADFGFFGRGGFSGTLSTDNFNGEIVWPGDLSLWPFSLNEPGLWFQGIIQTLRIEIDVADMATGSFTICPDDVNGDGIVNGMDLGALRNVMGECPPDPEPCIGDVNNDGFVDTEDRFAVRSNFGSVCPLGPRPASSPPRQEEEESPTRDSVNDGGVKPKFGG